MKKAALWMGVVSLIALYGCSNVHLVQPRPGCQRGVGIFAWDICEEEDTIPTPRQKIRGDVTAEE